MPIESKEKILIILPNLRIGGAEKLSIDLANHWSRRGFEVEVLLMRDEGELLGTVSPMVKVTSLGVARLRGLFFPLKKHFDEAGHSVIWSSMWPLTCISIICWILSGRKGRLYVTDHNHLSLATGRKSILHRIILRLTMGLIYPLATGITAVSKGVADDMQRLTCLITGKVKVIHNPAALGLDHKRADKHARNELWGFGFKYNILSVGELKPQKNHEMLIRAFARLPPQLNAKLSIVGDGSLRNQLVSLVTELNLQHRIFFAGYQDDPYKWYRSADLFVLTSKWEGFGNVLVESLECGTPVISTDCQSGPAEILDNGRYGKLVAIDDIDSLANEIMASLEEVPDRLLLQRRARDFSIDDISKQYLDYFELPLVFRGRRNDQLPCSPSV